MKKWICAICYALLESDDQHEVRGGGALECAECGAELNVRVNADWERPQ